MTLPGMLKMLVCLDSAEMAASRRHELDISRSVAAQLGRSAVDERAAWGDASSGKPPGACSAASSGEDLLAPLHGFDPRIL